MKDSAVDSKVECHLCGGEGVVKPPRMEDHPTDPNATQSIQEAKTIDDLKKRLEKVIMWYGRFRNQDGSKALSLEELKQRIDLVSIGRTPNLIPTHNGLRGKVLELSLDKMINENKEEVEEDLRNLSKTLHHMAVDYNEDPDKSIEDLQQAYFKYLKGQML